MSRKRTKPDPANLPKFDYEKVALEGINPQHIEAISDLLPWHTAAEEIASELGLPVAEVRGVMQQPAFLEGVWRRYTNEISLWLTVSVTAKLQTKIDGTKDTAELVRLLKLLFVILNVTKPKNPVGRPAGKKAAAEPSGYEGAVLEAGTANAETPDAEPEIPADDDYPTGDGFDD